MSTKKAKKQRGQLVRLTPEVIAVLEQSEITAAHNLTHAANVILARALGIKPPLTPSEAMRQGSLSRVNPRGGKPKLSETQTDTESPAKELAAEEKVLFKFELKYQKLLIGTLSKFADRWRFEYTQKFREAEARPLIQFPDTSKVYESRALWQFFVGRIPHSKNYEVRQICETKGIDRACEGSMLREFGRRTIANPYELISVS